MSPTAALRAVHAAELIAVLAVAAGAVALGTAGARRSARAGYGLALLGIALQCLGPLSWLFPWLVTAVPQPLAMTYDLLAAAGLTALGAAFVLLEGRPSRRLLVTLLCLVGGVHTLRAPIALLVVGPRYAALRARPVAGYLQQSTGSTCMPCCAAMALAWHGIRVDEGTMAARCRTTPFGTERPLAVRAIERAAEAAGRRLDCAYRTGLDIAWLKRLRQPAVLSVRLRGLVGHAILVAPGDAGRLWVGDPLEGGVQRVTPAELLRRYTWQGDALIVRAR